MICSKVIGNVLSPLCLTVRLALSTFLLLVYLKFAVYIYAQETVDFSQLRPFLTVSSIHIF